MQLELHECVGGRQLFRWSLTYIRITTKHSGVLLKLDAIQGQLDSNVDKLTYNKRMCKYKNKDSVCNTKACYH